jgi:hypothetical protein
LPRLPARLCNTTLASFPSTPSHEITKGEKSRRSPWQAWRYFFFSRSWEGRTASGLPGSDDYTLYCTVCSRLLYYPRNSRINYCVFRSSPPSRKGPTLGRHTFPRHITQYLRDHHLVLLLKNSLIASSQETDDNKRGNRRNEQEFLPLQSIRIPPSCIHPSTQAATVPCRMLRYV